MWIKRKGPVSTECINFSEISQNPFIVVIDIANYSILSATAPTEKFLKNYVFQDMQAT